MQGTVHGAWSIDVSAHLGRRADYKGAKRELQTQALQLSFDYTTFLGLLYLASLLQTDMLSDPSCLCWSHIMDACALWNCRVGMSQVAVPLQSRACKPQQQRAAIDCLTTYLTPALPADMTLDLLPNVPECCPAELDGLLQPRCARCSL